MRAILTVYSSNMLKLLFCVHLAILMVRGRDVDYVTPTQSVLPKLLDISFNCITETNADADAIQKLLTWTSTNTDKVKKYLYCFMNKSKFVQDDGHFIVKNILPIVGSHKKRNEFQKVLEECDKLEGRNAIDKVYRICDCTYHKSPILFSL